MFQRNGSAENRLKKDTATCGNNNVRKPRLHFIQTRTWLCHEDRLNKKEEDEVYYIFLIFFFLPFVYIGTFYTTTWSFSCVFFMSRDTAVPAQVYALLPQRINQEAPVHKNAPYRQPALPECWVVMIHTYTVDNTYMSKILLATCLHLTLINHIAFERISDNIMLHELQSKRVPLTRRPRCWYSSMKLATRLSIWIVMRTMLTSRLTTPQVEISKGKCQGLAQTCPHTDDRNEVFGYIRCNSIQIFYRAWKSHDILHVGRLLFALSVSYAA